MFKAGDLYKNNYYVYEHVIDGKVFYVGKGAKIRAVIFEGRNHMWNIVVKDRLAEVEVRIVDSFETSVEAYKFEKKHIKKLSESGVMLTNFIHNTKLYDNLELLGVTQEDIKYIMKKEKESEEEKFKNISLCKETIKLYSNRFITAADKRELCDKLYIIDDRGVLKKWPTVKNYLLKSGYEIEDKFAQIDKERTRVSIITIKDIESKDKTK